MGVFGLKLYNLSYENIYFLMLFFVVFILNILFKLNEKCVDLEKKGCMGGVLFLFFNDSIILI